MIQHRPSKSYLANVARNLSRLGQELDGGHPLVRAEACLSRKVVDMGHQPLHQIVEARIAAL